MEKLNKYEIAIVGAGPAGATAAVYLKKFGYNVCLIEKKAFPRETLCGEFLSNEVIEILKDLNLFDAFLCMSPNPLKLVKFINQRGLLLSSSLGFTAYGLRRGKFDNFLLSEARSIGVKIIQPAEVIDITRQDNGNYIMTVLANNGLDRFSLISDLVICAIGKQSVLDKKLNRQFTKKKSFLNGIKFHIPEDYMPEFPKNEIHIYSSPGIYCGVNSVDSNLNTVCFLENRKMFSGSSRDHLKYLIKENKAFACLFHPSIGEYINTSPIYGIGNIYFGRKELSLNGILMIGDAAGVIAPLAGDGIAMAMQSAKIISEIIKDHSLTEIDNISISYQLNWKRNFSKRKKVARLVQKTIMSSYFNTPIIIISRIFPSFFDIIIKNTREHSFR
ncbi:MAG: FAD-dependent monooxygenase [Bacteroidota bacterium]|nr:FAD-dependent monooxygenase [Bacteroidota bacterium]